MRKHGKIKQKMENIVEKNRWFQKKRKKNCSKIWNERMKTKNRTRIYGNVKNLRKISGKLELTISFKKKELKWITWILI